MTPLTTPSSYWSCIGLVFLVPHQQEFFCFCRGIHLKNCTYKTWSATRINLGTCSLHPVHVTLGDISFHSYADDTQLYLSFKPPDTSKLTSLHNCLHDIKNWMSLNFLQFNSDKTEVLIIGPDHISKHIQPLIGPLTPNTKTVTNILGVILGNILSLEQHVKRVVQLCFYHLRNISKIKSVLSFSNTERIIHALISSHLDYCNALFTCLNYRTTEQLSKTQQLDFDLSI